VWFSTSYVYLRMLIVNGKMLLKKKKKSYMVTLYFDSHFRRIYMFLEYINYSFLGF